MIKGFDKSASSSNNNNNNTDINTRFTSNEFKLKARRSIPTYTLTCNKHITNTQQGQQYTRHTRSYTLTYLVLSLFHM